eukprot:TRINITY_DN76459_c0_g1_i1.p1 TRINITY_DN76459_c0_g1~~TRINITY_DN76459_c0_g1_i1.p1  ORF type:complete len:320 (+),score=30.74 TRINITY_DN76459_c0_g1_i1:75-1034(+)
MAVLDFPLMSAGSPMSAHGSSRDLGAEAVNSRWWRSSRWQPSLAKVVGVPLVGLALVGLLLHGHQLAAPREHGAILEPAFVAAATGDSRLSRVLVTGYQPWGNYSTNPALEVAQRLNGTCFTQTCIDAWGIPVTSDGARRVADMLDKLHLGSNDAMPWDAVIHLGYESDAKGLRVELAAANVLANVSCHGCWSADVPCNKANTSWRDVHGDGPCLLASTAPLYMLELGMRRTTAKKLPEEIWSRDAGTFFCNEVYYRTLYSVRSRDVGPRGRHVETRTWTHSLLPVVFVHLPPTMSVSVEESAQFVRVVAQVIARPALQ